MHVSVIVSSDYCENIGTCDQSVCYKFCLTKNYTNNFHTYCLPPDINKDPQCCCRSPGGADRRHGA